VIAAGVTHFPRRHCCCWQGLNGLGRGMTHLEVSNKLVTHLNSNQRHFIDPTLCDTRCSAATIQADELDFVHVKLNQSQM
jgi:hypothetical protein